MLLGRKRSFKPVWRCGEVSVSFSSSLLLKWHLFIFMPPLRRGIIVTVDESDVLNAILPLITETRAAATVIDVVERVYPAFEALHQTLVEAADALTTPAGGTSDQQLTEVTLTLIQLRALADAATRATLTQTTNTLLAQSLSDQTGGPTAD